MALVALVIAGGMSVPLAPAAGATVCGTVGGFRVNVSGCADPFA